MKIAFFDIETKWLIGDIKGKKRIDSREDCLPELGLAVAGISINQGKVEFFMEDAVDDMIKRLLDVDMIVGHNVLDFDYHVIRPYIGDKIKELIPKTFDTLKELCKITGDKTGLGLDSLSRANFNVCKTHDSLSIPKMWRDGNHKEVKRYLENDVDMTRKLFYHGCKKGSIKTIDGRVINVVWRPDK